MTSSDFLRVDDRDEEPLLRLLDLAVELAELFDERRLPPLLTGRRLGMWWDGPGFRNRVAFELGAGLLGATTVAIPGAVAGSEPIGDVASYLGNWFDALVVRTPELGDLQSLAASTSAMTVNARTAHNHPCEILGDLAFLNATGRDLTEPLVVTFVGDATNLLRSWMEAAAVLPIQVRQVCPGGFEADLDAWRHRTPRPAGSCTVASDLADSLVDADVVYTDCWPASLDPDDRAAFADLRITAAVLDHGPPDLAFLPCPPVARGEEVAADAMEHDSCRVTEAKAWLVHAQNALLVDGLAESTR